MGSVLITGTSTGIGRATAVVLASRGWRVFATMRNVEKRSLLEQALKEADAENGVDIEQLDVLSQASIQAAAGSILSRTGNRLDAVIHNAGVASAGAMEDVPESELRRVMDTNFFGVLGLTRALLPAFRRKGTGGSSSFRARLLSWGNPQTRFIALPNGRSKDGPRPSFMSLSRLESRSFL